MSLTATLKIKHSNNVFKVYQFDNYTPKNHHGKMLSFISIHKPLGFLKSGKLYVLEFIIYNSIITDLELSGMKETEGRVEIYIFRIVASWKWCNYTLGIMPEKNLD